MTKTEQDLLRQMEEKGYAYFNDSRRLTVLRRLEVKYPEWKFTFTFSHYRPYNGWKTYYSHEVSVRRVNANS